MCIKWFRKKEQSIDPDGDHSISYSALSDLLRKKFPKAKLFLSDSYTFLCSYDDIASVLAASNVNSMEYVEEVMDCDDFAAALWGEFSRPPWSRYAVGLVWTDLHALNICVADDSEIYFIEPQTDEIQTVLQPWQGSEVRLVII